MEKRATGIVAGALITLVRRQARQGDTTATRSVPLGDTNVDTPMTSPAG